MPVASKKRLLLAVYLDFLFIATPLYLIGFVSGHPEFVIGAAATVTAILVGFYTSAPTPGKILLSIDYCATEEDGEQRFRVDPEIKQRESWGTMLLATMMVLGGTKSLVRWLEGTGITPPLFAQFGMQGTVAFAMLAGAASIAAGWGLFRLTRMGWKFSIALMSTMMAISIPLWDQWDAVIERAVVMRRQLQGIPLRANEVQSMQALFPEMLLVGSALCIVYLLLARKRFVR